MSDQYFLFPAKGFCGNAGSIYMGLQDHDEMAHRSVLQFRMEEEQVLRLLFPSLFSYPDFNSSVLIEASFSCKVFHSKGFISIFFAVPVRLITTASPPQITRYEAFQNSPPLSPAETLPLSPQNSLHMRSLLRRACDDSPAPSRVTKPSKRLHSPPLSPAETLPLSPADTLVYSLPVSPADTLVYTLPVSPADTLVYSVPASPREPVSPSTWENPSRRVRRRL